MPQVTLQEAQAKLPELISWLLPGEELRIMDGDRVLAVLARPTRTSWPSEPGGAKDKILWMAPDFDAPLEDFAEYME